MTEHEETPAGFYTRAQAMEAMRLSPFDAGDNTAFAAATENLRHNAEGKPDPNGEYYPQANITEIAPPQAEDEFPEEELLEEDDLIPGLERHELYSREEAAEKLGCQEHELDHLAAGLNTYDEDGFTSDTGTYYSRVEVDDRTEIARGESTSVDPGQLYDITTAMSLLGYRSDEEAAFRSLEVRDINCYTASGELSNPPQPGDHWLITDIVRTVEEIWQHSRELAFQLLDEGHDPITQELLEERIGLSRNHAEVILQRLRRINEIDADGNVVNKRPKRIPIDDLFAAEEAARLLMQVGLEDNDGRELSLGEVIGMLREKMERSFNEQGVQLEDPDSFRADQVFFHKDDVDAFVQAAKEAAAEERREAVLPYKRAVVFLGCTNAFFNSLVSNGELTRYNADGLTTGRDYNPEQCYFHRGELLAAGQRQRVTSTIGFANAAAMVGGPSRLQSLVRRWSIQPFTSEGTLMPRGQIDEGGSMSSLHFRDEDLDPFKEEGREDDDRNNEDENRRRKPRRRGAMRRNDEDNDGTPTNDDPAQQPPTPANNRWVVAAIIFLLLAWVGERVAHYVTKDSATASTPGGPRALRAPTVPPLAAVVPEESPISPLDWYDVIDVKVEPHKLDPKRRKMTMLCYLPEKNLRDAFVFECDDDDQVKNFQAMKGHPDMFNWEHRSDYIFESTATRFGAHHYRVVRLGAVTGKMPVWRK